jgi:hypothetical protein
MSKVSNPTSTSTGEDAYCSSTSATQQKATLVFPMSKKLPYISGSDFSRP